MIGFPIGVLTVNAFEWYAHKVWLHEYPMQHRNSPFFTHIRHHKRARLNGFHDEGYSNSIWQDQEMFNEKVALIGIAGAATVLTPVAPFFVAGIWYGAWNYWSVHSKCHLDPDFAPAPRRGDLNLARGDNSQPASAVAAEVDRLDVAEA